MTNPKDVMKKAEELAVEFAEDNYSAVVGEVDPRTAYIAGYTAALSTKTDKVQMLIEALKYVCRVTYGTEFCNTDEENNEILARHFFNSADKAREALKAYKTDEGI